MTSLTWWTWVWVNSGSWWWTGRPVVLRFMGSQRIGHDWATELTEIWGDASIEIIKSIPKNIQLSKDRSHQIPWSTECLTPPWSPSEGVEGQQLWQHWVQSPRGRWQTPLLFSHWQCFYVKSLRRVQLFATPWTAASQAPPSMGFSRQEHWSGSTTGANCSSGFMLIFFFFFFTMVFVFSCKSWNVAKPGARLVRPPPGAQQFQDLPPILSMVPWACAHSRHVVRAVSREVGNKVRGLPCFLFSEARTRLLPFNFPNTW